MLYLWVEPHKSHQESLATDGSLIKIFCHHQRDKRLVVSEELEAVKPN
jgi:hypothetical protein